MSKDSVLENWISAQNCFTIQGTKLLMRKTRKLNAKREKNKRKTGNKDSSGTQESKKSDKKEKCKAGK
jgi:hypothetical protein